MSTAYIIVAITTFVVIALHVGLYWKIRRWMDRDLALSLAGGDVAKQAHMLAKLEEARRIDIKRRDLPAWLQQVAADYADE